MARLVGRLRYLADRLRHVSGPITQELREGKVSVAKAYERLLADVLDSKPVLTHAMRAVGNAMAPTLNVGVAAGAIGETVLVRQIQGSEVHVGDVVVLKHPKDEKLLLRRIVALEGAEMVSDNPDDQAFRLPRGTCWVTADNENLSPSQADDSRTFGPLPIGNIAGRAVYSCRSAVDHGTIKNSDAAMSDDEAVLTAELRVADLAAKFKKETGGEDGGAAGGPPAGAPPGGGGGSG